MLFQNNTNRKEESIPYSPHPVKRIPKNHHQDKEERRLTSPEVMDMALKLASEHLPISRPEGANYSLKDILSVLLFRGGGLFKRYRRRFGIESGHRIWEQARARTASRMAGLRLLLIGPAVLLHNLWVLLKWAVVSIRGLLILGHSYESGAIPEIFEFVNKRRGYKDR